MATDQLRVVVPDDAPPVMANAKAWPVFQSRHKTAYYDSLPGSEEELLRRLAGFQVAINIRSSVRFTRSVFAARPELKMLSIWGTGTDNVDLDAAREFGVTVTNTPGVAAPSIAEHTLGLLLAAARRLTRLDAETRAGGWPRGGMVQLTGKTCGVIGLGAIGKRFATIAAGIGMRVITWSFHEKADVPFPFVPLDELLETSDVVSLHLRLSEKTRQFIGREQLAKMKPGALFVNTARGAIVDEAALIEALASRRIAAAGLDVFETEPLPDGHPVTKLDNVVISPHCAGITPEVLEAGLALSLENVERWQAGAPQNVVA
jgi:D-3-phosphoglycerate dehydrogenase